MFEPLFLLGVMSSKWWISHERKRIRVHLPVTKKYLADMLKYQFGGTVHTIRRPNQSGITWQATSDESFTRIKKAAQRFKSGLPAEFKKQLFAFLTAFGL